MPRNKDCTLCPLHKSARNPCVWGEGPEDAEVMVIGEAPGRQEDERGRPFIGQSGQLIRSELAKAGIHDVYITNVVKCRPPDNRTPTPAEAKTCAAYLAEEINHVKPRFVITLGALASKTVLKKPKITQAHGQVVNGPGYQGMPVFHPAYALRDMSKLPMIKSDLARFRRLMDGELVEDGEIEWEVVGSQNFRQFLQEFREAEEFSFDVETSSLNWFDPNQTIRCLGIGLPKRSWVIPLDMPESAYEGNLAKAIPLIRLLVKLSEGKTACGQNAKFDNHWLKVKFGVRFFLDFDVMLASHVLDENTPHDLEYLARNELDAPEYDIPLKEKKGANLHFPSGRYRFFEYNAKDTWYTLRLMRKYRARLRSDKPLYRLFYRLVMHAARALEEIEENGLTLDLKRYAEVEEQTKAKLATQLAKLQGYARKYCGKEINWNAPKQVATLLYEKIGIECKVYTDKGAPSTGEEALLGIKGEHEVADELILYRELERFVSTYLDGWKEYILRGQLYLSYKIHGTVTGRYSSRLHSVPRDGTIRNLVVAPPGWEFCQADISQAELRVAAELSGDLELIRCFRPGGVDVHWRTMLHTVGTGASGEYHKLAIETAKKLLGDRMQVKVRDTTLGSALAELLKVGHEACIAINKAWKEARKRGKSINFGFVYGMYPKKFIETCKLKYGYEPTIEEATAFRQAYFELYTGLPKWHEKQKTLVKLDGFVRNLFGRLRRLPSIYSTDKGARMEAERQAINSPVQGTIGDWKAAAMVEIHETLPHDKLRIVGEHHDALLMIVKDGCEDEVLPDVRRIMKKPALLEVFKINMRVPMESEIELGPWGAGEKYERDLEEDAVA